MHTNRSFFGLACRVAAFSFLAAGTASLLPAQSVATAPSVKAPIFLASESAPIDFTAATSSSSSSSFDVAAASESKLEFGSAALAGSQPPPRRSYGRPNYGGSNTNPDGSNKYTFMVGGGLTLPIGDTHRYNTPSWGIQAGGGRNFNKSVGVLLQFDYDNFGLQGSTLANQNTIYDFGCPPGTVNAGTCGVSGLDGNTHVWSFTLDPTFTLATEGSLGAYAVVGGGYYHKVTNFTEPVVEPECGEFGCGEFSVNETVDDYTSNAGGVNGGIGLTYKFSKFSNQRFYMEARYVVVFNEQRTGVTAANVTTAPANSTNFFPANSNRTAYIPIKFGIRF